MEKHRILLVGDSERCEELYAGVEATLEGAWCAERVADGEAALKYVADGDIEVVLTCHVLDDMNGADLLREVKEQSPRTIRFVAADQADKVTLVQTAGYVHQVIGYSGDAESAARMIVNSLALRRLLTSRELTERIAAIGSLPSPPDIYQRLVKALKSDDVTVQKVADLVSRDIGITAKLLQLVNSAYFGLSRRVDSVVHAISLLGLDMVERIVFSAGVFRQFEGSPIRGMSIENVYNRSMAVGAKSRLLAHAFGMNPRLIGDALMGGMLHDVGKLVLLTNFQQELTQIMDLAEDRAMPLQEAAREILGVDDAAIGAYLLALWGLPDSIVEAVALHYSPNVTPKPLLNSLTAVHLGYALHHDELTRIKELDQSAVDLEYLERLGILDQLQGLQNFCAGAVVN